MRSVLICLFCFVVTAAYPAGAQTMCIVPSDANGVNGSVDCHTQHAVIWNNAVRGFSATGDPGCEDEFCGIAANPEVPEYGWSISASATDPHARHELLPPGVVTLYLWLYCSEVDGISAAEFGIEGSAGLSLLGLAPLNGTVNAGTFRQPLLAVGGCPSGPFLAAALIALSGPVSVEAETWSDVKAMYR